MVKPSKSMQPEHVAGGKLKGRTKSQSFSADSFHNYLARKIDLQRQQFGVHLPPAPPSPLAVVTCKASRKRPRPSTSSASAPLSVSSILDRLQQKHGKGKARIRKRVHNKQEHNETTATPLSPTKSPRRPSSPQKTKALPLTSLTMKRRCDEMLQPGESHGEEDDEANKDTPCQEDQGDEPSSPLSLRQVQAQRPDLFFLGVVIKVNGYTDPDSESLKRMVQRYGGDLETYETTRVTHIIAETMATAKAKYYARNLRQQPKPVVTPAWILDSIQAQKLLPHGDYLLESVKGTEPGQRGIKELFPVSTAKKDKARHDETATKKSNMCLEDNLKSLDSATQGDYDDEVDDEKPMAALPPPPLTQMDFQDRGVDDGNDDHKAPLPPLTQVETKKKAASTTPSPLTQIASTNTQAIIDDDYTLANAQGPTSVPLTETGRPVEKEATASMDAPLASQVVPEVKDSTKDMIVKQTSSPLSKIVTTAKGSSPRKSDRTDSKYINGKIRTTSTDPNFLESFFANSRLSFIGSYKQRITSSTKSITSPMKSTMNRERFVFHVDMDCFFANVVLRKYPQYRESPVAISHHGNQDVHHQNSLLPPSFQAKSTSECATCNYHARKYGIKKGMFLGRARELCRDLVILPYDFEGYEEVSEQVLEILQRVASEWFGCVEAVSCDEAYVELFLTSAEQAGQIAEALRQEILETTQCTASIGVATNKFLAKVGTDRVKPNGAFVVQDYRRVLESLRLRDLHGVGYRSEPKLAAEGLITVQDVWDLGIPQAESTLSRILGPGLGTKIVRFCQGRDDRPVQPVERKTIGAECNYGVRFEEEGPYGIDHFMKGLATEVSKRMTNVGYKGAKLTLKVKQRKVGAKAPPKFLGHGSCHNLSKSMDLPGGTPSRDAMILSHVGMTLFRELDVPLQDVRGMGMVVSKLASDDEVHAVKTMSKTTGITSYFQAFSGPKSTTKECETTEMSTDKATRSSGDIRRLDIGRDDENRKSSEVSSDTVPQLQEDNCSEGCESELGDDHGRGTAAAVPHLTQGNLALPPLSQICMSQVAALPPEMQSEIKSQMIRHDHQRRQANEKEDTAYIIEVDLTRDEDNMTIDHAFRESSSFHPILPPEKQTLRQTNLKRMMKLAAVVQAEDPTRATVAGMSLQDFRALPLEVQLQIANEDSQSLGALSQKRPARSTTTSFHKMRKPAVLAPSATNSKMRKTTDDRTDMGTSKNENEHVLDTVELLPPPTFNLFEDDIVPLHQFLDDNATSNPQAMDMVHSYFRTCLVEGSGRMNALRPLLRSLGQRQDEWGTENVRREIAQVLDETHMEMYGKRLDVEWFVR